MLTHGWRVGLSYHKTTHLAQMRSNALRISSFFADTARMEIRHLRYFVAVAEEQHFSRAAHRVGIEQSPLSRAIRALERDIGVNLLERSTKGSKMTPAGQIMLHHARSIIEFADGARREIRAAAGVRAETPRH